MDVPTFQAAYPAFRETDPDYIEQTIARATRLHDATVWGALRDDGIALLTASYLVRDPYGTSTALQPGGKDFYFEQWQQLQRSVVGAFAGSGGR